MRPRVMQIRLLAVVVGALVLAAACGSDGTVGGDSASSGSEARLAAEGTGATDTERAETIEGVSFRFGAVTQRMVDLDADGGNATAAVDGMNAFAIDLYRAVATDDPGNVVVSPYSVTFALGMIYAGAGGDTATEMTTVLHAGGVQDWQEGVNAYDLTLDARTAGSPTAWSSANKVWTSPGLPLRNDYLDILTGAYGSPLAETDFASDVGRKAVNTWVADQTEDRIPELFPPGTIDPTTAMVLVNAVALDAPWEFPFDPEQTVDGPFTRPDGSTVTVATMRYDEYLPAAVTDSYQAVELPYGGGALSMVIVVPEDLTSFEADLSTGSLQAIIDSINDGGIHLTMPKWQARTHLTLNDTLIALGMPQAFDPARADFSGMTDGGGLWLDRVEHEAFVEVDEQGTRAAAATGGAMADSHGPTVEVDRPFLYLIRDQGAGTILFIGRVNDPTLSP